MPAPGVADPVHGFDDTEGRQHLQQAAISYWDLLHDTVAACQSPRTGEADILRSCAATWGTVYGIARLAALQQIPRSVPSEFDRLIHEALDTLRLGWARSA